jgi:peptidoglycan/LPS O-acetylase OafA/YrhL
MSSPPSARYRSDIDGLRAVAVLLVVAFHYFRDYWPGGFVGVDIFFVISGFLITGLIVRELDVGKFSLLTFYGRRVRRIFPALIVLLCSVLLLGWLWLLPSAYAQLSSDVVAGAAFSANIALWLKSGYFDIASAKKPLLHLWSLGIEEQFYLVWPLMLMLAARLRLNSLAVAAGLATLSLALNVAMIDKAPIATFYLPFTRAWELLAGGVLALSWSGIGHGAIASNLRALTGTILIAAAVLLLDPASAFPGWWALLPVAGTALLLSAPSAWGCRHLLSNPTMVWFGLISYPLYLWHWPLRVFFTAIKFNELTLIECWLTIGLSILVAWATYRFIEIPIRFGRPNPAKALSLCGGMVAVAIAGAVVVENAGFDFRLPAEIRAMASVTTQAGQWRVHQCMLDLSRDTNYADECVDRNRRPLLFVWGDSSAGALMPGLLKAQQTHDFGLAQFTASSCTPALHVDITGVPNCRANNDRVLARLLQIRPEIVLLHGIQEKYLDHIAETVATLKRETDARVVVLGAEPLWDRGLPSEVLRHYMLYRRVIPPRSFDAVQHHRQDNQVRNRLVPAGAEFISASDVLCDAEGCLTRIGDQVHDLTTSDVIHLTEKGSIFLVDAIIDRVLNGQTGQRPWRPIKSAI